MTWTKLTDDFGDQCAKVRLTDAAFRTHVEGMSWAMRRETAGVIDEIDVKRFAETKDPWAAIRELLEIGWWEETGDGRLQIIKNMDQQVEVKVIEARREADNLRQRRKRMHAIGDHSICLDSAKCRKEAEAESTTEDVSRRDTPRDNTRDPGLGWSGLDGAGKPTPRTRSDKEKKGWSEDLKSEAVEDWPETPPIPVAAVEVEQPEPKFDFLRERAAEHAAKQE